jgi:hypothetical protein
MDRRGARQERERPGKFRAGLVASLIAYGEHQFRLARRLGDGASEGAHRASAARVLTRLGHKGQARAVRRPGPKLPFQIAYLWDCFRQIDCGIASNGFGPPLITWSEIAAFCALTGTALRPWEVLVLVKLSVIRANIDAQAAKKK